MSDFMNIDDQPELHKQYLNDIFPDIFKKFPNLDYGMFDLLVSLKINTNEVLKSCSWKPSI